MANDDSVLNQDLNSGTSFSPAHKHLQDDSPETVVSPKNEQAALDRLGIESARRAAHRFQRNASVSRLTQRSPSNASDFRDAFLSTVTALGARAGHTTRATASGPFAGYSDIERFRR